jgi:hypothetical protein
MMRLTLWVGHRLEHGEASGGHLIIIDTRRRGGCFASQRICINLEPSHTAQWSFVVARKLEYSPLTLLDKHHLNCPSQGNDSIYTDEHISSQSSAPRSMILFQTTIAHRKHNTAVSDARPQLVPEMPLPRNPSARFPDVVSAPSSSFTDRPSIACVRAQAGCWLLGVAMRCALR